jgi:hypothetical protein
VTVENYGTGSAVAHRDEDMAGLGLEDASISDIVIPRIRIVHDQGVFEDNLSKEQYPSLRVILLGLVKQRLMWADDMDEGDKPQCKSPNFEQGFPSTSEDIPKDKRFPWKDSVFNPADFPPEQGVNGLTTLPCVRCNFKEWGQDKKPPRCMEQHTYPLMFNPDPEDPDFWSPALFTVQKTGIKPSRNYLSSFVQAKKPMFTAITELNLTMMSRGTVKYSVPSFKRIGNTEQEMWEEYANTFKAIREFAKTPPRRLDDGDGYEEDGTSNVNTPAPTAAASTPAPAATVTQSVQQAPVAQAEPAASSSGDDEDLPF